MESATAGVDRGAAGIRDMFAAVAPRYDLLNHLLSAGLDLWWRRRAAAALADSDGPLLDLCCGTGDQALALRRRRERVVAADFCLPMLVLARRKFARLDGGRPLGVAGDALRLPLPADRFAGVSVSFGLRNVADLEASLAEILRVLRPGGRLAALEFALPRGALLGPLYRAYFHRLLPAIGGWVSPRGSAYRYLPDSVSDFPQRAGFVEAMGRAGFVGAAWRDLNGGIVCLYTGSKP